MTASTPQASSWREAVIRLAQIDRPSASEGERRAAEWICEQLRALGCSARVEQEQAHGGYWWPIGVANSVAAAAALAVLRRDGWVRRAVAAGVAGASAAALWDDLGHGRRWFRRALFPHRPT